MGEREELNIGHGHVFPRPDGMKMRCGGPGLCTECSKDLARKQAPLPTNTRLKELAAEFDAAPEDASWEPPHPIFQMAADVDRLNAELAAVREAAAQVKDVAVVLEDLGDNEARVRWLFNPVPYGEVLLWNHGPDATLAAREPKS